MENFNLIGEFWRPVRGFKNGKWFDFTGLYEVSNLGKVRSLPRNGTTLYEKLLKPLKQKSGYYQVHLSMGNVTHTFRVHRLVAWAFPEICGDYFDGAVINHRDEDKSNNRAENLEWCSNQYNQSYGTKNLRGVITRIKNGTYQNWNCRVSVRCFTKDGKYVATFSSIKEAAKATGANESVIGKIVSGYVAKKGKRYRTSGGYLWEKHNKRELLK